MIHSKLKNPLQRNGLARSERFLKALNPEYAPIDNRSFSDFLSYAWRFSSKIRFFDTVTTADGPELIKSGFWQDLLKVDSAFYLSVIASLSSSIFQKTFEYGLRECASQHDHADWQKQIEKVFKTTAEVLYKIEEFRAHFPALSDASRTINAFIDQHLKFLACQLSELNKKTIPGQKRLENEFKHWLSDWNIEFNDNDTPNDESELPRDLLEDELRNIFETIIGIYNSIVTSAGKTVERSTAVSNHQPHIGLFFSFIKLFQNSQDHLNSLTARHLDFYYKDILKLSPKPAEPDQAHVIFTPAKKTKSHKLDSGCLFKAGKDSRGQELLYALDDDFVVNQSTVCELKNCFGQTDIFEEKKQIIALHQGKMANSQDGTGKPLSKDDPKWSPFGNSSYEKAKVGFGLSSPIFRLSEGKRKIIINITVHDLTPLLKCLFPDQDVSNKSEVLSVPIFDLSLSGAKKWLVITPSVIVDAGQNSLKIILDLGFDCKEIADYEASDLADEVDLKGQWPIIKAMVNQQLDEPVYHGVSMLEIDTIAITVSANSIRDLVLQNDKGILKAAKPFQPFGPLPVVGSNFYVGHRETFSKKIDSLELSWNWVDLPDDLDTYYKSYTAVEFPIKIIETVEGAKPSINKLKETELEKTIGQIKDQRVLHERVSGQFGRVEEAFASRVAHDFSPTVSADILNEHEWQPLKQSVYLPIESSTENNLSFTPSSFDANSNSPDFKEFGPKLSRGGVKITLQSPSYAFGHKKYPKLHAKAVAASVRQENPTTSLLDQLNVPITPIFENFSLSYSASEVHEAFKTGKEFEFYHFHPFGFEKTEPVRLLPHYNQEGYLYIGLKDCAPPQNVSLLFNFAEGSGDPFIPRPKTISWSYCTAEGWKEITRSMIASDTTLGFLESGIIVFSIPEDAVSTNSMLPEGLHWLRLTVSNSSQALHDLISVTAQAATVTFKDKNNASDHLATALPAGTIAKFKVRNAAIKSVDQPYASFGGKPQENSRLFYNRTSERLRHKNRAVSIWDYEHLVLDEFPDIYKVKCLNHTTVSSEIMPGHVLVVVIPDLQQKNSRYPLRPAVPQSRLLEIENFLKERASAYATIKVVNPLYESIQVSGTVHFYKKYQGDKAYYKNVLHDDITRMLTPWLYGISEIGFAGRIHRSSIINFIEELEYVDYLTDFGITHFMDGQSFSGLEEVVATTSRSILVSHDAHSISHEDESV